MVLIEKCILFIGHLSIKQFVESKPTLWDIKLDVENYEERKISLFTKGNRPKSCHQLRKHLDLILQLCDSRQAPRKYV